MTTKERLVKILDGRSLDTPSDAEHIAELLMENGVIFNDEMKRRIMQATKSDVYCPYCHKNNGYRMTSGFVYTFKMED